jgi:hypothetical protein
MKPITISVFSLVFVELLPFPHRFPYFSQNDGNVFRGQIFILTLLTTRWRKDITDKHFKKTLAGEGRLCSNCGTKHYQRSATVQPQYWFVICLVDRFKEHLTSTHEFLEIFRQ